MALTIESKTDGNAVIVMVKGGIDEDANFVNPNLGSAQAVTLDLDGVTAINSVGIREWIKWIKAFPTSLKLSVRNCPKIIVDQINMVAGFLPPGTGIESFYVPYYSDATGSERMVLFVNGKEFNGSEVSPPSQVVDDSGESMEIDVIEAKYFKFLKND